MRHCVFLIATFAICWATAGSARGTSLDWTVTQSDCDQMVLGHEMADAPDRSSGRVEGLRVSAASGTFVYAEQSVDPSLIIDDLVASVWVRSDRRGIQILGRVVLPNSLDPESGRPDTVLIPGEVYQSRGEWRKLRISGTPKLFRQRLRVLRARTKRPVDERGAYLDTLVMNVYGGPGATQVWFGEVTIEGNVGPPDASPMREAQTELTQHETGSGPELRVSKLSVDGKPFFPRIIDHQGEPFELLKRLGFNTIHLPQLPTPEQQDEARRLGLWLVCRPPEQTDEELAAYPNVLAWHLGNDVSRQAGVRRRVDTLRRNDPRKRLLVGGASDYQWIASRQVDVLLRNRSPLGTTFPLSQFGPWLDQTTRLVRPGTPFWACIQTELPESLVRQVALLDSAKGDVSSRIELEQIRQLTLAAIAAGSRGLWFRSRNRLDASDSDALHRRLILERLNVEIALFAPWVMGGHRIGDVPCENPRRRIVALTTERSRLLVTTQHHDDGQYVSSATNQKNTIVVAGVPDSTGVFLLSPIGLRRLLHRRISGGIQISVDADDSDAAILMTEDPLVVSYLNRQVGTTKTRAAILEYQVARRAVENLAKQLDEQEASRAPGLLEARDHLRICHTLLETGNVTDVFQSAQKSRYAVSRDRHRLWQDAISHSRKWTSHPATTAFHLLPYASIAQGAIAQKQSNQGGRLWPGGDCENLAEMIRMGWSQHQSAPPDLQTYIALSPRQPKAGDHCLRIRVTPQSDEAGDIVVESPPVSVRTAPIAMRPGQPVRITGWIRIDQPIEGSLDGLLIVDSIGGPDLALRLTQTDGWQQFEMIRTADHDDRLSITFALSGIGEIWLDDLRATRAEPADLARRDRRRSVSTRR